MTLISKIDEKNIDKNEIEKHAKILKSGNTVIFPTETVYGLGANALDENAVSKIYKAKGRPSDNPLIVHIHKKEQVEELAKNISLKAHLVMDNFWPGPITIILNKKEIVPSRTSGGLNTVAIRMPSNEIATELLKITNLPIAAPSANISGRPSPTKGIHVIEEMNNRVDGIILGGDCTFGLESTVLDLTNEIPIILRPGSVTKEQLEEVVGKVDIDPALENKDDNIKAKAPGMKYKHYSPNAEVYIVSGEKDKVANKINNLTKENEEKSVKTVTMCLEENKNLYKGDTIVLGANLDQVAANLFDSLIMADKQNYNVVYTEAFPKSGVGRAIMNRLLKSAGYKIIYA